MGAQVAVMGEREIAQRTLEETHADAAPPLGPSASPAPAAPAAPAVIFGTPSTSC